MIAADIVFSNEADSAALVAFGRGDMPNAWRVVQIIGVYGSAMLMVAEVDQPSYRYVVAPDQIVEYGSRSDCLEARNKYCAAMLAVQAEEELADEAFNVALAMLERAKNELEGACARKVEARTATQVKLAELRALGRKAPPEEGAV